MNNEQFDRSENKTVQNKPRDPSRGTIRRSPAGSLIGKRPAAPRYQGRQTPPARQTDGIRSAGAKRVTEESAAKTGNNSPEAGSGRAGVQRSAVRTPAQNAVHNDGGQSVRRKPARKKGNAFKKGFLIYLGVLIVLSVVFLIYVHSLLLNFESSQIDNVLADKLSDIREAASDGNIEEELSLESIKEQYSPSGEELKDYEKAISEGELTVKKSRRGLASENDAYDIYLNGFRIGSLEAKTVKEGTVLAIFPVTEWEIVSCKAEVFSLEFPSSVTVTSKGNKVAGKPSGTEGVNSYPVSELFGPDTVITDSVGNTAAFDGKTPLTFVSYTARVLSNYRVWSGERMVDPAAGTTTQISSYKYVREYCDDVPDLVTYELCVIGSAPEFTVKDENGNDVEFTLDGTTIDASELKKSETLPEGLKGTPDPIKVAETWSLFMTQDLKGKNNGFAQLEQYLIKGSYLYENMWKFATGIDITFTSNHYLQDPPFSTEVADDFVKYTDECFSCHIKVDKPMRMTNGVWNTDTLDSIFYFVYIDDSNDGVSNPHWAVADRQ